jgi:elongation factor Ts
MAKGWLTQEQADEARKLKESAAAEKAASLNQNMIENIAKGRVQKFLKENCLVDQEFQFGDGDKATVSQWLAQQDKELKIVDFKRFTLVAE